MLILCFILLPLTHSLTLSMASSSSSLNWVYDVFLSFRGEDVPVAFRSHFLKELDRKLITAFKDNEIERSHSLWPELVQAIRTSRIAVVIFSKNYASSSWCLNELLEIVNCKDNIVIPVFYGLDPSHVRYQTGDFGRVFQETCINKTEEKQNQWKKALTDVAIMLGFHSATWGNEAKMIEVITNDVLDKLLLTSSKDSEDLVGIEAHIAEMSLLLQLESEEVRMVGIWGSSGTGKTTIARILFNRLSRHSQGSIFIDRAFISKSKKNYSKANPDDPNMKLHLRKHFLSEIMGKKDIKIDHLDALGERLKHKKVLIIIDDLDDQVVLDTLVGQTHWFGCGSRIIVVTNEKHFLRAHGIDHIYEVSLPTEVQACQMLCRSAFKQNYAPEGFRKLIADVVRHAGNNPLDLNLLGKHFRGRDKEFWMHTLPRFEIENILRISYDLLGSAEYTKNQRMDGKVKPPKIRVFINFRGVELRNNFVGYLVDALRKSEINFYIDYQEPRGEDLNVLFKRIEDSGIAIVVFSSRYTESEWCLDELVKIKERVDQGLLKVLPIFYKVNPTNVKRLKGDFGDHFREKEFKYESDEPMIKRWKEAIRVVSHKFALTYDEKSSVSEINFVETIVKKVLEMLQAISKVESGQSSCNLVCVEKAKLKRS